MNELPVDPDTANLVHSLYNKYETEIRKEAQAKYNERVADLSRRGILASGMGDSLKIQQSVYILRNSLLAKIRATKEALALKQEAIDDGIASSLWSETEARVNAWSKSAPSLLPEQADNPAPSRVQTVAAELLQEARCELDIAVGEGKLRRRAGEDSVVNDRWPFLLELFVDDVDNFAMVQNEPVPAANELTVLEKTPEERIKHAFAEIIGEPHVPKDWAGERSDLFSTYVRYKGRRIATAFVFKGPARFHPMTLADLGKKGDQINRLFSEPADLLVLQHCHRIEEGVRQTMRAFADRRELARLFLLIDGFDTIRLLRAYGKCGFSPTATEQQPA